MATRVRKEFYKDIDNNNVETKWYKWIVEFEVSDTWVSDGFDLTDDKAKELLRLWLQYAYDNEIKAKVINAPSKQAIREEQGW